MKKTLASMMIAALVTSSVNAAQIEWGNDPEIFDYSGVGNLVLESYTSYSVRLYKSTDANIDFGLISPTLAGVKADDVYTGVSFNWNSAGADGFGATIISSSDLTFGINAGNFIYSVIFNNSNVAGGTGGGYFAIVDDALATVSYPGDAMTYNPGAVTGGLQGAGGDWVQVVPEPATFMLFAIGGMGAWMVRRNKMKVNEEDEVA